MIDTMEIKAYVSKELLDKLRFTLCTYNYVVKELFNINNPNTIEQTTIQHYCTKAYSRIGFLKIELKTFKIQSGAYLHQISIRYKPAIPIYQDTADCIYRLCNPANLEEAKSYFQEGLAFISKQLHKNYTDVADNILLSLDWKISRIDYACQFNTCNYEIYIKLLKMCYKDKKNDKYKTSIYERSGEVCLNFYDKTVQLASWGYTDEDEPMHVVRLEIQCYSSYLHHLLERKKIHKISFDELWNSNLVKNILKSRISRLIGTGDFYSLADAEERLNCLYKQKKAIRLLGFLKLSQTKNTTLSKMKLDFFQDHPQYKSSYIEKHILPELDAAGISPILLPKNCEIRKLINPINQV